MLLLLCVSHEGKNRMKSVPRAGVLGLLVLVLGASPSIMGAAQPVEIRDGVLFEKNVSIPTDDGAFVMSNVFRPKAEGRYPVLLSMSIYGKDIHTRDFNPDVWEEMVAHISNLCERSSCEYHSWETPDPEVWVADGYVVIRVDACGSGKSPGTLDPFSAREARDLYKAIEWAATQPWSSGKVGLAGISYYAMNQWVVAALRPPHLAAIAPWEGAHDGYRDVSRHGGILSNVFPTQWAKRQLIPTQNGNAESHFRDMDDGSPVGGPKALSDEELERNRTDLLAEALKRPLDGPYYRERTARLEDIAVPLLSGANWGGFGLHGRGNFNGFRDAGSSQKWLEVHTGDHIAPFYAEEGHAFLKQFYDHFLKGEDNGWAKRPPILLDIRHADGTITRREESEWPLARTEWRKLYLDGAVGALVDRAPTEPARLSYEALGDAALFTTPPLSGEIEVTGPMAAKLYVSSSTEDMDIFATVQAFAPDGTEATFPGASEPAAPIAQGWLRVSHRKLDAERSRPWQPYHTHDEEEKLVPGQVYEVDVEIWPGQVVLPSGYRIALRIEGKDFARPRSGILGWARDVLMDDILHLNVQTGSGFFLHNHPEDRPKGIYGGDNTIHTGGEQRSYLLIPVIPKVSPPSTD
jgi:predicted acyl esterase